VSCLFRQNRVAASVAQTEHRLDSTSTPIELLNSTHSSWISPSKLSEVIKRPVEVSTRVANPRFNDDDDDDDKMMMMMIMMTRKKQKE